MCYAVLSCATRLIDSGISDVNTISTDPYVPAVSFSVALQRNRHSASSIATSVSDSSCEPSPIGATPRQLTSTSRLFKSSGENFEMVAQALSIRAQRCEQGEDQAAFLDDALMDLLIRTVHSLHYVNLYHKERLRG